MARATVGASFLERLDCAADAAAARAGGFSECDFDVDGCAVRLQFAGPPGLQRLASALARRPAGPGGPPALVVRIWDSASSGLPEPVGPWSAGPRCGGRAVRGHAGRAGTFFLRTESTLSVLDARQGRAWFWLPAADDVADERAAPLSAILGVWVARRATDLVHAAAVGTRTGCVLLAGPAGAGKSHAALACLGDGMGVVGDDTCLLRAGPPPVVRALYSSAQAGQETLERLPWLVPMAGPRLRGGEGKALVLLGDHGSEALVHEAPLRAIATVHRADGATSHLRSSSPGEALLALAPSSLLQLPGAGQEMLARVARIAAAVPCVRLEAGSNPARLAAKVRSLL